MTKKFKDVHGDLVNELSLGGLGSKIVSGVKGLMGQGAAKTDAKTAAKTAAEMKKDYERRSQQQPGDDFAPYVKYERNKAGTTGKEEAAHIDKMIDFTAKRDKLVYVQDPTLTVHVKLGKDITSLEQLKAVKAVIEALDDAAAKAAASVPGGARSLKATYQYSWADKNA